MTSGLVDLTMRLTAGMPVFLGHARTVIYPTTTHEEMAALGAAATFRVEGFHMSTHEGTHVDVPAHVRPGAATVCDLPLESFRSPAICLDVGHVEPRELIEVDDLERAEALADGSIDAGDTVLLRTGHFERAYRDARAWRRHTGLSAQAATWMVDHRVTTVGIDAPSLDSSREVRLGEYPAHRVLLGEHGILIVENLVGLERVAGRRFAYTGYPIALDGVGGAPIRAVAQLYDEEVCG